MVGMLQQLLESRVRRVNVGQPDPAQEQTEPPDELARPVRVMMVVGLAHVDGIRALWKHLAREGIKITDSDLHALKQAGNLPTHLQDLLEVVISAQIDQLR